MVIIVRFQKNNVHPLWTEDKQTKNGFIEDNIVRYIDCLVEISKHLKPLCILL
jgi:hypothetical protein